MTKRTSTIERERVRLPFLSLGGVALLSGLHEHAYLLGKNLIWAKEDVGHGNFLNWVETNLWFGERTAYHFMAFAKKCNRQGYLLEYHPGKRLPQVAMIATIPGTYRTIIIDPPWPIEKIEGTE
jgi:hypothetical protein